MTEQPGTDPRMGLNITRRTTEDTVVVAVAGDVDLETAPQLHTALAAALREAGASGCVADLTDVTFLGSTGLAALAGATSTAEQHHKPLKIVVDGNRTVIHPIEITGLDEVLHLYHSVDEALRVDGSPWPHRG